MNKKIKLILLVLFVLTISQYTFPIRAQQTNRTLVVLNTQDAGAGSLRQAILDAPDGGIVTFAQGLTGSIFLNSLFI